MKQTTDTLLLSATDLSIHLGCGHATGLDRAVAEGRRGAPSFCDPNLALLRERGLVHERAYVDSLREAGVGVVDLREVEGVSAAERTVAAMRAGQSSLGPLRLWIFFGWPPE